MLHSNKISLSWFQSQFRFNKFDKIFKVVLLKVVKLNKSLITLLFDKNPK